jgi:LmbE family N-acetylglucosaminyl deacetylase
VLRPDADPVTASLPAGAGFASRYAGKTVLAIGAHPDDLEIGAGGMLARFTRGGARTVMAVVSVPGDYETRLAEARSGAKIIGAELHLARGGSIRRIEDLKNYELVKVLDELVREFAPDAVLTHGTADFHADHLLVHNACVPTQRLRSFDFFGFQPSMCRPVPTVFHPRAYVDISDTIDIKMQSIMAHASQFQDRRLSLDMFRDYARFQGRMVGVEYAEGLDVMRMMIS